MANKLKKKTSIQKVVKKVKPVTTTTATKHGEKTVVQIAMPTGEFMAAVGRRKTATARVRVYRQAGDFVVNNLIVGEYFRGITNAQSLYNLPLMTADVMGKYAIFAKVSGSGMHAQVDAVNHGVARALIKLDPELRPLLKKAGLLSRDDRMKETRKVGMGGKARRRKQSPKR